MTIWSRDKEHVKNPEVQFLEMKTTMSDVKNIQNGINSRLDVEYKKSKELE